VFSANCSLIGTHYEKMSYSNQTVRTYIITYDFKVLLYLANFNHLTPSYFNVNYHHYSTSSTNKYLQRPIDNYNTPYTYRSDLSSKAKKESSIIKLKVAFSWNMSVTCLLESVFTLKNPLLSPSNCLQFNFLFLLQFLQWKKGHCCKIRQLTLAI